MGVLFVYILKSSVCLAVFYLFYRLLLSRETFHRFNRVALLGILLFSCLLPLVEVSVKQPAEVYQAMMTWEQWLLLADAADVAEGDVQAPEHTVVWIQVMLLVYLLGILFFVVRNVCSLCRLCLLLRSGRREDAGRYVTAAGKAVLVVHEQEIAPFSWMRHIVISRKDLEENGREILVHELAHIRNRHSWDLLAADCCIFFQWFNPAAWLLKQELQNIHEYEADETVISEGVDARQYQLLLIKKAVGTRLYSMANSFNHSKLKKRITMMMKEKSNPWARLKYLYVLPVAAIAVTAFARPEVSETVEEISAVKVNDLAAIVETKVTENVVGQLLPGQPMPKDTVAQKGKAQPKRKDDLKVVGVKGETQTGKLDETVVVAYASKDSLADDDPVFEVVEQMPSFPGGMQAMMQYLGKNIRYPAEAQKSKTQGRVVVSFIVGKTGDVRKVHILRGVDPALDKEAIRVIEAMPKWTPGRQRGKEVAVRYTVPVVFRLTKDEPIVTGASGTPAGNGNGGVFISFAEGKQPLCLIDGKEVDFAVMRALDPSKVENITIVKDKAVLEGKYGEKGKNGVILITLKSDNPAKTPDGESRPPIQIINGKSE